jgi:hypothetical protein
MKGHAVDASDRQSVRASCADPPFPDPPGPPLPPPPEPPVPPPPFPPPPGASGAGAVHPFMEWATTRGQRLASSRSADRVRSRECSLPPRTPHSRVGCEPKEPQ